MKRHDLIGYKVTTRVEAYGMLAHYALDRLWMDSEIFDDGCELDKCAACAALKFLDEDGVLDHVLMNWDTDNDGKPVLMNGSPPWWKDGKVDREWLHKQWS